MADHEQSDGRRAEIADVLAEARVVREALRQDEPDDDSQAKHELTVAPETSVNAVHRLITVADLWTLFAADQLYGLSLLVRDGATVFPVFPILRSILEHGAAVAWVLDTEVDIQARTARAALAELRSREEAVQAAALLAGKEGETYRAAKERLDQLRLDVRAEFGPFDQGGRELVGEWLPRPSDLINHFSGDRRRMG